MHEKARDLLENAGLMADKGAKRRKGGKVPTFLRRGGNLGGPAGGFGMVFVQ